MAINLRSDLHKLTEDDLSIRLQQSWQAYDEAEKQAVPHRLVWSARGPFRHPAFYPLTSFVAFSGPIYMKFGFAIGPSLLRGTIRPIDALMRMHFALCEARDVTDEIQRRVTNGKTTSRSGNNHPT